MDRSVSDDGTEEAAVARWLVVPLPLLPLITIIIITISDII